MCMCVCVCCVCVCACVCVCVCVSSDERGEEVLKCVGWVFVWWDRTRVTLAHSGLHTTHTQRKQTHTSNNIFSITSSENAFFINLCCLFKVRVINSVCVCMCVCLCVRECCEYVFVSVIVCVCASVSVYMWRCMCVVLQVGCAYCVLVRMALLCYKPARTHARTHRHTRT